LHIFEIKFERIYNH